MNQTTKEFLLRCKQVGYIKIGINTSTTEYNYSFYGIFSYVCALDDTQPQIDDWPAIWAIVEELGITNGAGNGHSYQIRKNSGLETGIYDLSKLTE